jgi:diacylglycerol kinase family enzyme
MEISVDGGRRHRRRAMTCLIGNVGKLPGGLVLMPDAEVDDGRLDVYVAAPLRIRHWLKLGLRVVTRREQRDDKVDSWQANRVVLTLRRPESYQLDGDVVGEGRQLVAQVRPGALTVCVS